MKLSKQQSHTLRKVGNAPVHDTPHGFQMLDGTQLNTRVVKNLIAKGMLLPNGDGLFDGMTQT